MTKDIYMMMVNKEGYNKIMKANEEITAKTNEYIETDQKELIQYTNFSINKYDSVSAGLQGTYNDFYELIEKKEEEEEKTIISPNQEKIKAFCAWINRLTT